MKKIFKNNDLIKIVGLVFIFTTILTWIIHSGLFSTGSGYYSNGLVRVGILDMFSTSVSVITSWFFFQVTFLLVLGGFYGLLTKVKGYQALVSKVAKSIKGREIFFVLAASFVFAFITSISYSSFQLLLFMPFVFTVILRAKMDKITAICTTFGGVLIGVIGGTFSGPLYEMSNFLGVGQGTLLWLKIILFVVSYGLFNYFSIVHIKKTLKQKESKKEEQIDTFEVEEASGKTKIAPLLVIFGIIFVLLVLGYIDWVNVYKVEAFTNLHAWINEFTIGEHHIFQYIIGGFDASSGLVPGELGTWDLFIIQIILIVSSWIIAAIYKVKSTEYLAAIGEGIKKMLKPMFIFIFVYSAFALTINSTFVPTIVNFILGWTKSFNIFVFTLGNIISSFFTIDLGYIGYLYGAYYASIYSTHTELMVIVMNTMYGLLQFIAPTSVLLMVGLSYADVKYKDWIKYIWKFVLAMFILLIILFTLMTYVF